MHPLTDQVHVIHRLPAAWVWLTVQRVGRRVRVRHCETEPAGDAGLRRLRDRIPGRPAHVVATADAGWVGEVLREGPPLDDADLRHVWAERERAGLVHNGTARMRSWSTDEVSRLLVVWTASQWLDQLDAQCADAGLHLLAVLADADILPELVRFIPDGTREHVALAYHRPGERVTVSVDAGEIVTLLHEDAPEEGRWAVPSTPARGLWVVGADAPVGAFPLDLRLGETVVPAAYAPALAAGLAWLGRPHEVLNLVSEEDAEHRLSEARQAYARRMLKRVASTLLMALTVAFGGQWVGAQGVQAARTALGERSEDRQEVAAARAALDVAQQRVDEADALLQSRTSRGAELARVAGAVPDGVWIDAWDVGAAGMTVHGLALREQAVARFLNRLEALPGVERVHLQFVQQTPARSLYRSSPVPDSVDVTQFELSIPSTASK